MRLVREQNDFIVVACKSCGKQHTVEQVHWTKTSKGYDLTPALKCPCGNVGIEAKAQKEARKKIDKGNILAPTLVAVVVMIPIIVIVLLFKGCSALMDSGYEKKDFKDITNKEYNDFMKWDKKQQEQKRDSEKVFGY